jgi:glycosyltransferase involved in cell wall biosynthesis
MKKLSVVITTFNSMRTIGKCLEAVKWADEIIVVDSESRDGTIEICRGYSNCRLLQNLSPYPNINKNYGFEQASGEWILYLDSDEVLTPEISQEIKEIISSGENRYDGYYAANREMIFGKWVYYVWGQKHRPQRPLFFRKGYLKFECKHIHEIPTIKGRWGYLENWYEHYPHPSISQFIDKMNIYTDKDIERVGIEEAKMRFRWHKAISVPLKTFFIMYIKNQGFRDGSHGLMVSILVAFYNFIEYAKLWELRYKNFKDR